MCIENHSEAWRSIAKRIYIIRWNLDKTFFSSWIQSWFKKFSESVAALNLFAKAFASVSACDNPNVTRIVPQRWWRTCGYVSRLQNVSNIFKSTVIHDILRSTIPRQKHPAGPETVLVKIEFYKKKCVFPQRGNHCCHLKSGKFGRPNLGVFWANGVFATVKRDFLVYFDWTSAGILFTLSFAASVKFSQAASCTC
jgi:hypothetical protein